jgi:FtsH-binding integral membrane protein
MIQQSSSPFARGQIQSSPWAVAHAEESVRTAFIRRTYLHLAGAIAAFIGLEIMLFTVFLEPLEGLMATLFSSPFGWLFVMIGFVGASRISQSWARSSQSQVTQYMGLGLFVVAEALIFFPMLWYADRFAPGTIRTAAIITGIVFGGLTFYALTTKKDFSGLGRYLALAGLAAIAFIVCNIFFQISGMGTIFASLMVLLAAGSILYETSNIVHHYQPNQHVAAALGLFASVALMFYYILYLLMSLSGRD